MSSVSPLTATRDALRERPRIVAATIPFGLVWAALFLAVATTLEPVLPLVVFAVWLLLMPFPLAVSLSAFDDDRMGAKQSLTEGATNYLRLLGGSLLALLVTIVVAVVLVLAVIGLVMIAATAVQAGAYALGVGLTMPFPMEIDLLLLALAALVAADALIVASLLVGRYAPLLVFDDLPAHVAVLRSLQHVARRPHEAGRYLGRQLAVKLVPAIGFIVAFVLTPVGWREETVHAGFSSTETVLRPVTASFAEALPGAVVVFLLGVVAVTVRFASEVRFYRDHVRPVVDGEVGREENRLTGLLQARKIAAILLVLLVVNAGVAAVRVTDARPYSGPGPNPVDDDATTEEILTVADEQLKRHDFVVTRHDRAIEYPFIPNRTATVDSIDAIDLGRHGSYEGSVVIHFRVDRDDRQARYGRIEYVRGNETTIRETGQLLRPGYEFGVVAYIDDTAVIHARSPNVSDSQLLETPEETAIETIRRSRLDWDRWEGYEFEADEFRTGFAPSVLENPEWYRVANRTEETIVLRGNASAALEYDYMSTSHSIVVGKESGKTPCEVSQQRWNSDGDYMRYFDNASITLYVDRSTGRLRKYVADLPRMRVYPHCDSPNESAEVSYVALSRIVVTYDQYGSVDVQRPDGTPSRTLTGWLIDYAYY